MGLPLLLPGMIVSPRMSDADLRRVVAHFFNQSATDLILDRYAALPHLTNLQRAARITRDFFFLCSTRRLTAAISSRAAARLYFFDFPLNSSWAMKPFGDYHASELPFVFGN